MFIFKKEWRKAGFILVFLLLFFVPLVCATDINKILSTSELYIIFLLFGYGLIIFGYLAKTTLFTMLGSMLLVAETLFLFTNDFGAFTAYSTQVYIFALVTLAFGFIVLIKSSIEMLGLLDDVKET